MSGSPGAQPLDEGGQLRLVVRHREGLPDWTLVDIQAILGHVETDEEVVHDPSL